MLAFVITGSSFNPERINVPPGAKVSYMTGTAWYMDQVDNVIDGVFTEYKRGKKNTTGVAYQNFKIVFRKDGTATHTDEKGNSYPARWKFTDASQTELVYTVYFKNTTVTNTWEMFEVNDKYLYSTTHLSNTAGDNDIEVIRMISSKYMIKGISI